MLGPMDEFPVHQIPQPIAWPGTSDRNFYDRSYFNAHDRTGDIFLITGIGYYPNLGVKDAFVLVRRGDKQTRVHLSDAIDQDRLNQNVIGYRVEVTDPLHRLRIVMDETEGMAVDLTWNGLFDVVQEQRHILRVGYPNHVGRAAVRAGGLVERAASSSTARRSPSTRRCGSARGTGPGASGPSARPNPRAAGGSAVRGHVVAVRADGVRRLLDRPHHPGGAQRLPVAERLHPGLEGRPRRATGLAAGQDPLHARAPASRPARPSTPPRPTAPRCASMWNPNCPFRFTSAAATAATRTGSTACGRARSSPSG